MSQVAPSLSSTAFKISAFSSLSSAARKRIPFRSSSTSPAATEFLKCSTSISFSFRLMTVKGFAKKPSTSISRASVSISDQS